MMGIPNRFSLLTVVAACVLTSAGPASAQPAARCHNAIARSVAAYQLALVRELSRCHEARSAGQIPLSVDCNDAETGDLDQKADRARQKASRKIETACRDSPAEVLALYARCPTPVAFADDGGASTGIDDFQELTTCLVALSDAYVERMTQAVLGSPATLPAAPHRQCQSAIANEAVRLMRTVARARNRCQKAQQSSGGNLDFDACAGTAGDTDGRIASALTELDSSIDEACDFNDGHELGACGYDAESLRRCAHERVLGPITNGLVASAQELPGRCPSLARLTVRSAGGRSHAATRLDLGYLGTAHGMDVVDGFEGGVRLSDCDENCEDCAITFDRHGGNCRCDLDSSVECSTIAGSDPACGGGLCNCSLGPPRPEIVASIPACHVDRIPHDIEGRTGAAGEFDANMDVASQFYIGMSLSRACPLCVGDDVAKDGVRNGSCSGGAADGSSCDASGTLGEFGTTSLDCMPSPGALLAAHTYRLGLTSGTSALAASVADLSACADGPCHCSVCSGDASIGCASDADCADAGAGTCGADFGSFNPKQNACTGGPADCVADSAGNGTCNTGPIDRYCDGPMNTNGRPFLPCADDNDCAAMDCNGDGSLTAGECGTCSSEQNRSCFLPIVTAVGKPDVFRAAAVAVFCVPPAAGPTPGTLLWYLTSAPGFPGPGRLRIDFDLDLYCGDGATRFDLPGGSSCP